MKVQARFRYAIRPTPEQEVLLRKTVGCARYVYNRGLALWEERYTNGERTNYSLLCKMLPEWKQDKETEWLKEVPSQCLQQAMNDLCRAYKNFFERRARHPKPRKKHKGAQSARFGNNGFEVIGEKLVVAKMNEPLNVIWHRPLPGEPTSMTVILEPTGEWFVSFVVKVDVEEDQKSDKNHSIGLDLGLDSFCVLSTGEKIENPRHYRKNQRRLKKLQRRLARKQKGSKNREKARKKVAKAHARIKRMRADFHHKLARRLVRENQVICVENLCIKGMARTRMAKSIYDAGWGTFIRILEYKCKWYGSMMVKIGRFEPTTKTCSSCGVVGEAKELSIREWTCDSCGAEHDRDVNAAINIRAVGLQSFNVCGGDVRHVGVWGNSSHKCSSDEAETLGQQCQEAPSRAA